MHWIYVFSLSYGVHLYVRGRKHAFDMIYFIVTKDGSHIHLRNNEMILKV